MKYSLLISAAIDARQRKNAKPKSSVSDSAIVRLTTNILKITARTMSKTKNVKTVGGLVNAKVLEDLQQSFNTLDILDALDVINSIRSRICDIEDMQRISVCCPDRRNNSLLILFVGLGEKAQYLPILLNEEC